MSKNKGKMIGVAAFAFGTMLVSCTHNSTIEGFTGGEGQGLLSLSLSADADLVLVRLTNRTIVM